MKLIFREVKFGTGQFSLDNFSIFGQTTGFENKKLASYETWIYSATHWYQDVASTRQSFPPTALSIVHA
jgi:hypothetical protein